MTKDLIAIDMDDVLVATAPAAIAFYNQKYGTRVTPKDFYGMDYAKAWQAPDKETAVRRVNEYLESDDFFKVGPDKAAVQAVSKLGQRYQLCIVTGRPGFIEEATRRWLVRHFSDTFSKTIFTDFFDDTKARDKGQICKELNAVALVDDHTAHLISAAKYGIQGILFGEYAWNQDRSSLPDSIVTCVDWPAVLEYFDARS